jgi:putative polyhydroxyalkanoate system protein
MADIDLQRPHGLDWYQAQALAMAWRDQAQNDWGMTCVYTPGDRQDSLHFERPGAKGHLTVDPQNFVLQMELGFLMRAYKRQIADKINSNLDAALAKLA